MDDAHHMVFNCVSICNICRNHPSSFISGSNSIEVVMIQYLAEVAPFVYESKRAY